MGKRELPPNASRCRKVNFSLRVMDLAWLDSCSREHQMGRSELLRALLRWARANGVEKAMGT